MAMIREKYYCGLDIGSQRIKVGVLKARDIHHVELVGIYEKKTEGFKDASVTDLGELSECVHSTVQTLVKKIGIKFKEVYLGVGGALAHVRKTNTAIPLIDRGNKIITRRDVKKVNDHARLLSLKMDEETLHDLPQHYVIDDINSAINPCGLYGRKLGVHSLMVIANANRVRNIVRAVNQAGYDVPDVSFSSYAAARIALTEEEQAGGCALIDMGAQSTNILIFKEKVLMRLEKMDSGGDGLTRRIAARLNLPFDLAEEIKKSYATVSDCDRYQDEEILVKRENAYAPVKRRDIFQSIEPEVERSLGEMAGLIKASGLSDQISQGVVMIGAGALLPGFIEKMGQAVNRPVKLGKINITAKKNLGNAASFSAVIGLAQAGFQKSFGYAVSPDGHGGWGQRAAGRIRELYQEYF